MIKETMDFLMSYDKEVGEAMKKEFNRQNRNLELIASENIVSEAFLAVNMPMFSLTQELRQTWLYFSLCLSQETLLWV